MERNTYLYLVRNLYPIYSQIIKLHYMYYTYSLKCSQIVNFSNINYMVHICFYLVN